MILKGCKMKIYNIVNKILADGLLRTVEVRSTDKVLNNIRCYLDVDPHTIKEVNSVYFYIDTDNVCKLRGRYKILSDNFEDDINTHNTQQKFYEFMAGLFDR